jgi:hypothetical protein
VLKIEPRRLQTVAVAARPAGAMALSKSFSKYKDDAVMGKGELRLPGHLSAPCYFFFVMASSLEERSCRSTQY